MHSEPTKNPPNLLAGGWLAESMRVSFFMSPGARSALSLSELLGVKPEQINDRPGQGMRQEIAGFQNGLLILSQIPGRVDVVYAARQSTAAIVHIGDLEAATVHIHEVGKRFCDSLQSVNRIAFGPIAVRQAASEAEAAALILQYLPFLPIEPGSDADIIWQINKRRPASSFQGQINHVFKWQALNSQLVSVLFPTGVISQPLDAVTLHIVRVEVDVNTAPSTAIEPFAGKQAEVYEEIFQRTRTLQERGAP